MNTTITNDAETNQANLIPVITSDGEAALLCVDESAVTRYRFSLAQPITTPDKETCELTVAGVTLQEALGRLFMDHPALRLEDISHFDVAQGRWAFHSDDEIFVPVEIGGEKHSLLVDLDQTDTWLVVFHRPIKTDDPNGDRLMFGAISVAEAVGWALHSNPHHCYNDILDHMTI